MLCWNTSSETAVCHVFCFFLNQDIMFEIVFSQTVAKSNSTDVHVVEVLVCVYAFHVRTRVCVKEAGKKWVDGG